MLPAWESFAAVVLVACAIASGAFSSGTLARLAARTDFAHAPMPPGWLLMWHCVLSQIGFVRSLFDLDDRDRKNAAATIKKQR